MNIKNDYSFLFNSLNNSKSNAGGNLFNAINLSEYSSIKTGSYGKLLKAYYAEAEADIADSKKDTTSSKKNTLKEDTAVEKLTEVSGNASTLQDSAEKLISRGKDSLFKEKEMTVKDAVGKESKVMGYDTDAIYKAVKDFTDKYNSFMKSVHQGRRGVKIGNPVAKFLRFANNWNFFVKALALLRKIGYNMIVVIQQTSTTEKGGSL